MGNPSSGSKVQTTMSLSRGRHRQSHSADASLQLEKLAQLGKWSGGEKPASSGGLSPRTTEEQSINTAGFPGDKQMRRRTPSSVGGSEDFTKELELNGVALGVEERKPLNSVSLQGHRRVGSPRAKGTCPPPGVEKYAVARIAASAFHSPRKLERSMSLSRVAHKAISDADGAPRSRAGVGEVILPNKRDTLAESNGQDSQRELESRLQAAVAAHRSENGLSRNPFSELLEKKAERDIADGEHSVDWPFSCIGSGTPMSPVKGADENSHPNSTEVQMVPIERPCHGLSVSTVDHSWPNDEHLCSNAASLPVKDTHPGCFETSNQLRTEQATCSLSNVAAAHQPCSSRALELHPEPQSGNLSESTHLENSYRSNHPDLVSTSTSFPVGFDVSYQDMEEVTQPEAFEAPRTKLLVCNHEDEAEPSSHSIDYSADEVTTAELTEPAFVCKNGPAGPAVLIPEESNEVVTDGGQGRAMEEIHFSQEKEAGLRKTNGSGACLRKSSSFELGLEEIARNGREKRTKLRKRRRSFSASGIGAMINSKVVRVSEPGPLETRSFPKPEPEVSGADLLQSMPGQFQPPFTRLHQDAQFEIETIDIEAVDMDIEFEDCSSELVAPEIDACYDASVEDHSSANKDTKRLASEEVKQQLVDYTQLFEIKNYTEGGRSECALHDSQEGDHIAGSGPSCSLNDECERREISSEMIVSCNPQFENKSGSAITADGLGCSRRLEGRERFLDARERSLDRDSLQSSTSGDGWNGACNGEKVISNQEVVTENARGICHRVNMEEGPGGNRRRQGSQGRISHGLDSSSAAIHEDSRRSLSLVDEDVCMITSLELGSRSFASMLQASPRLSGDESLLAQSSIAILTNPSFSSSHQDRLWEEQAEYSSGGRGTPGREDDPAAVNVFLHSPSPSGGISSDDHIRSTATSLRKSHDRGMSARSCSGFASASDSGRSREKRSKSGQWKTTGRPQRSPLRSLLAAKDWHSKPSASHRSPERGGHFLQQLLSRIRGRASSSKCSSPKSSSGTMAAPKRRNSTIWSSCMICFSHVK